MTEMCLPKRFNLPGWPITITVTITWRGRRGWCTNGSWPHLPTDNTVTSPSFFSFTSATSSFARSVFGTVARVWWVSTNAPSAAALFCRSAGASKEGRRRGCWGFRGSLRESSGGMSTGGHFLWAQRVQQ